MEAIDVRPEVAQFALAMEERLRANVHKNGKLNNEPIAVMIRLEQEAGELRRAISSGESPERLRDEAADVANFAMMIAGQTTPEQVRKAHTFPVLMIPGNWREYPDCPRSVPYDLVEAHARQAERNHGGQSIATLARRGGLDPRELWAVCHGVGWHEAPSYDDAIAWLKETAGGSTGGGGGGN
ncbi:MAG: hypothetical protein JWO59_692 [Chloroflexi bacterium]|nr:hypothetical protein [Chloroflexota bacterium]